MSAWIVSKAHITLLTEALFRYEVVSVDDGIPDQVGQMLWEENHRSVNARYDEHSRTPRYRHNSALRCMGGDLQGTAQELVRHAVLLLKQIGCYEYQSCEHDGWDQSRAAQLMQELHKTVCRCEHVNADAIRTIPGWENAPWGID